MFDTPLVFQFEVSDRIARLEQPENALLVAVNRLVSTLSAWVTAIKFAQS